MIQTSCDRVEAEVSGSSEVTTSVVTRPDARSRVSPEVTETDGQVTPNAEASPPPSGPSGAASTSDTSSLGARHKTTLSKEKKLTGKTVFFVPVCLALVVFAIGIIFYLIIARLANRIFLFFQKFTGQENLGLNLPPA